MEPLISCTIGRMAALCPRSPLTYLADTLRVSLREATSALHKAVTKGALHRNTASRRISQLSTKFNALRNL